MKSLPIFKSIDNVFQLMQTSWAAALNPMLKNPLANGLILDQVSLIVGDNVINHLLGRPLQGWIVIGQNDLAEFYDLQEQNSMPEKTLILNSSDQVMVNLYVF